MLGLFTRLRSPRLLFVELAFDFLKEFFQRWYEVLEVRCPRSVSRGVLSPMIVNHSPGREPTLTTRLCIAARGAQ